VRRVRFLEEDTLLSGGYVFARRFFRGGYVFERIRFCEDGTFLREDTALQGGYIFVRRVRF
jgi:hypothetical protein